MREQTIKQTLLVVDDEKTNLHIMEQILHKEYQLHFATSGQEAIALALQYKPDMILLDVVMPEMDGFETCRQLKQNPALQNIPVIFVTGMSDIANEYQGFKLGAVDYISKPVSPPIVLARIKNHLSLVSIQALQDTQLEIVRRLGRAAEYKDNETGLHVIRMSHYSMLLSRAAGMTTEQQELILHAAPMHDVGKIGIPDHILLKPGRLSPEEWHMMSQHPQIGADIIGTHPSPILQLAHQIALTHHERWDGKGYPNQLQKEQIPLVGRIIAIADVFDALTTKRPYKAEWPVQDAVNYMLKSSGSHFDPELIVLFYQLLPDFIDIKQQWSEQSQTIEAQAVNRKASVHAFKQPYIPKLLD